MSSGAGTDCLEPFSGLGASDVALRAATSDELQDNGQAICKRAASTGVGAQQRFICPVPTQAQTVWTCWLPLQAKWGFATR